MPPAVSQEKKKKEVKHGKHNRSNSTSSLYVTSTIEVPDVKEMLLSVSTLLHCQMVRDDTVKFQPKIEYFNEDFYTKKICGSIPDRMDIYKFLKDVFEVGEFHPECAIIFLVYINRFIGMVKIPLTCRNWKPVSITSLLLAQKVWDDQPLANADFSILYNSLTLQQINNLELRFLLLIQYKLSISTSLYARYYFELRDIIQDELDRRQMPRLTQRMYRQLERRAFAQRVLAREVRPPKRFLVRTKEDIQFSRGFRSTYFVPHIPNDSELLLLNPKKRDWH